MSIKFLKLNRRIFAIVDAKDFEWANQFKWYAKREGRSYRVQRNIPRASGGTYLLHRELLGIKNPRMHVDHRDMDQTYNSRINLRTCDHGRSQCNRKKWRRKCISKYKGVAFHKRNEKWWAHITVKGKRRFLGSFRFEIQAARAYDAAAKKLHGEFARLNLKDGI